MTEPQILLALPEDDNVLIRRRDVHKYGFPAAPTLAKWACRPSEAPCELEYVMIGHNAAYSVATLRKLREVLTYKNSTERSAMRAERLEREVSTGAEAA